MKSFRWQIIIILLTGLVVGLLLLSEQTGFRLVSPVPTRGGVYSEGLVGRLQRLNPVLDYYNSSDRDINRLIFSSLVRFDSQGLPEGDLAESWGISFDGLTYNFLIRGNATWHDGEPVTAQDVAFTIELMRDPESVLPEDIKEFWNRIDVIPLDEKNLQIKLQDPFAPMMDYLNFGVLPQHLLGGLTYQQMITSEFNINPIGSGPFRFQDFISEGENINGVILAANINYYNQIPFIQEFVFRYYPDLESALNAYKEGIIQGISDLNHSVLPEVLENPNFALYSSIKPEISMVLLNLNNRDVPFFQDKEIRRALLMGLDRAGLINRTLMGQGVIADVPILPTSWAYYSANPRVDQDNQQARRILNESGYVLEGEGDQVREKENLEFSFSLVHPSDDYHTLIAQSIRSDWQKIGIQVELIPVPYDSLILDYLEPLTYEAALIDLNYSRSPDPDPYPFWDQTQQSGGQNYSQWENRIASQYLEEARISRDLDERSKLYRNFQAIFTDELPALPLFYPIYNYSISNIIQGVGVGPMFDSNDRFWNVGEWYLITQSNPNPS